MDDITSAALVSDPETRRTLQLDTLSAILPMERRDRLAELLTDDDVATLKHLAREGMGENSLRALASDLAYLEAWAQAATGTALPWPASESLTLKFVAHHLWDPVKREADPQHGMPADVAAQLRSAGLLRSDGPHAPSTVKRRVEQLNDEPPVPFNPQDPKSETLPCVAIQLGRTKTGQADEAGRVLLVGPPVEALREWLERADIAKGPIFRAIDRWEAVEEKALTPQSINLIVKRRCALAGLEAREFSSHGLRSGYLTEAAQRGVSVPEAMQQS